MKHSVQQRKEYEEYTLRHPKPEEHCIECRHQFQRKCMVNWFAIKLHGHCRRFSGGVI